MEEGRAWVLADMAVCTSAAVMPRGGDGDLGISPIKLRRDSGLRLSARLKASRFGLVGRGLRFDAARGGILRRALGTNAGASLLGLGYLGQQCCAEDGFTAPARRVQVARCGRGAGVGAAAKRADGVGQGLGGIHDVG